MLLAEAFRMTDAWLKFAIALGTALICVPVGIAIKEMLDRARDRRKDKRLSYDLIIGSSMTNVPENLAAKVSVDYDGKPVQGQLFEISCTIENTGLLMVKDQYVRFSFLDGYTVLNSYPIGEQIPERGVIEVPLEVPRMCDRRWKIGQLEKSSRYRSGFSSTGPRPYHQIFTATTMRGT